MEIKDGKTGSPEAKPHGSPGRKKEIREIKKPFREPAWGQPEEPGGGTKRFGEKKGGPGRGARRGPPQRLKPAPATPPHPLECSTIAVPGLSFRVRNGTGRLTWAMAAANLLCTVRRWGSAGLFGGLGTGQRTRDMSMFRLVARQCLLPSGDVCRRKMRSNRQGLEC